MAGRDGRLQRVRSEGASGAMGQGLRLFQRRESVPDEHAVPPRAVLLQQQDRLAVGGGARPQPRRLQLEQRHQPVDLRLVRRQRRHDARQPHRLLAQLRAQPVVAGGGAVALIEDEVEHLQHRGQPRPQLGRARHLERHAGRGQGALGPHDPLRDRRLGDQVGAGDLVGGEPA